MKIYWFWPFPARGENPLALATLLPGDQLTLHSLATRFGVPIRDHARAYRALRELPESHGVTHNPVSRVERLAASLRRTRLRRKDIGTGSYDICHIHALSHFADRWAVPRLSRHVRVVSTIHDVLPHSFRVPQGVERRLLTRLYRDAGVLVVAHDHLRRRLISEFSVEAERIAVIPLPIHASTPRRDSSPGRMVLFFGSFRSNKGVDVLLEAIRRIPHAPDVRFHFTGRGSPDIERLVEYAARRDTRIRAEIGYVPPERKESLFSEATLVALPYTSFASQSGVLHDAYSFRVPVVVSDVGALGESVREDGTGWVVPPRDPEALAGGLSDALEQSHKLAAAHAATERVAKERSVLQVGRRLRELYDLVVSGRPIAVSQSGILGLSQTSRSETH